MYAYCDWYEQYAFLPSGLECVLTFCDNATTEPNITHNYALDWNGTEESLVTLDTDLVYPCMENMRLENTTNTKDEASSSSLVRCGMDGFFRYPDNWTLCSETIQCGQPPNMTEEGFRTWMNGVEYYDYYDTDVEYGCVNGSQFDTNNDGYGDAYRIVNKCLWNKTWSPYPQLPKCKITHCVDPFDIPLDTMLEEETPNWYNWTLVGQTKTYRCQGMKSDGTHTMFFKDDRSLSEFEMLCLPDGTFKFINETKNWPICLEGKCVPCASFLY